MDEDLQVDVNDIKKLPVEDNLWMIEQIKLHDDDGTAVYNLRVTDKFGKCIGQISHNGSWCHLVQRCRELIVKCSLKPLLGVPRKPRKVTFKDPELAGTIKGFDLTDMDIIYTFAGRDYGSVDHTEIVMRHCAVCKLRASSDMFRKCGQCEAVLYCSKVCQRTDWNGEQMEAHCHQFWCDRMKHYMGMHKHMSQLPFTFMQEVCGEMFDMEKYCRFLAGHGVLGEGAWAHECPPRNTALCPVYGELTYEDAIVLPVESTILDEPLVLPADGDICDWESYYRLRGLRLDSPVAILLQWPLTLYHVITQCREHQFGGNFPDEGASVSVDILGVEKEVDLLPLFKELSFLLPHQAIDINMYGHKISKQADGRTFQHDKLTIKVVKGLYHKKCSSARIPHLAIGFNAGLGAYSSWVPTLHKLQASCVPAYFTDYCRYSCECSRIAVEALGLGTVSEPVINPYRSPVRKLALENDLPWYSNGFLYHLVYR